MEQFSKSLGAVLNRPAWASVPSFALSLLLGEMADMLLNGQRALPAAAQRLGYQFKYPIVAEALKSLDL
jgi:NAD dependent epimerase/dehydratase family enzyme